jgi:hypothetical protein
VTSAVTGVQGWFAAGITEQPLLSGILLGAVVLAAIAIVIHKIITESPSTAPGAKKGSTASENHTVDL